MMLVTDTVTSKLNYHFGFVDNQNIFFKNCFKLFFLVFILKICKYGFCVGLNVLLYDSTLSTILPSKSNRFDTEFNLFIASHTNSDFAPLERN